MEIVNKVAQSGLIELNLEEYFPEGERIVVDLKPHLFQELILKEEDFREWILNENWKKYEDKYVAITCTADAIIPVWAYMLVASSLQPYSKKIVFGALDTLEAVLFNEQLKKINPDDYRDKRVVIKGCSNKEVPISAYVEITNLLRPVAKSIMYGEPCSTVPVYKRK